MKKLFESHIIATGLAIFSMLFGAGNLMYPLQVGMESADKNFFGMLGFTLTAICLPVAGFVGMILFNGNYKLFFERLGKTVGSLFIFVSMLIIGPIIAIPRITTLSHIMISPFLPGAFLSTITPWSSFAFALIFLGITFLITHRASKIVDVLGKVISPLLLLSLTIIMVKGLLFPGQVGTTDTTSLAIFTRNLIRGYETLDLLGGIFFSSIVLTILKKSMKKTIENNPRLLAKIGLQSSLLGVGLLALVYIGMSLLGKYHGTGLETVNPGELFRAISFVVLGQHGAAIIAIAVLMACLSTSIALSAIVAEYLHNEIFHKSIGFASSLIITLLLCLPLATAGLTHVVKLTGGIITYVGYPVLITLTMCNIAYKLWGFKPVKIPVALTFIVTLATYYIG